MPKENANTIFKNGVTIRTHNKRVQLIEKENSVYLNFRFADENADSPACIHRCLKGVVRQTEIQLSKEMMDEIVISYIKYRQHVKVVPKNEQ